MNGLFFLLFCKASKPSMNFNFAKINIDDNNNSNNNNNDNLIIITIIFNQETLSPG